MTSMVALSDNPDLQARTHLRSARPSPFQGLAPSSGAVREDVRQVGALVHVADFDEDFRRLLIGLFSSVGFETRSYGDFNAFLQANHPDVPACLVIDARLPLISGFCLNSHLRPLCERLPVVVTADQADVSTAVEAMKAGAIDFIEKPFREQDVLEAAGAAIRADRERRLASRRQADLLTRFQTLSRRERQVMALVTAGRLNKQVAGDLGLSEITVKVHRGAAMRKMGARTLVDLVRMADAIDLAANAASALAEACLLRSRN